LGDADLRGDLGEDAARPFFGVLFLLEAGAELGPGAAAGGVDRGPGEYGTELT